MAFGLVFAGGGVRGAYHIGVWQALRETGADIKAVCGSSIGAINGALFAQGSFDTALELWEKITLGDIVELPEGMYDEEDLFDLANLGRLARLARKNGGLSMAPLERLLRRVIDEDAVRSSEVNFGLTAYSVTEKRLVSLYKDNIPKGMLVPYLMASSSLPGFRPRGIGGEKFIDGSVGNTMPVDMIMNLGADDIITVNVKGPGIYRDFNTAGRNIITIEWKRAALGTMEFDSAAIKRCIAEGRLDCLRAFGKLWGDEYYFDISEFESVRSRFGERLIGGIQHAAKAFGLERLRVTGFEELARGTAEAYAAARGSKNAREKTDDAAVICRITELLLASGFDAAKSKLDILGKNYSAASAVIYFMKYFKTAGR